MPWNIIIRWLDNKMGRVTKTDLATIILIYANNTHLTNQIMIVAKNEIYKRKWKQNIPSLYNIKVKLKKIMSTEMYLGTITNQQQKALGKWSPLYNKLKNL